MIASSSLLVDREVTRVKFRRELELWRAHAAHAERGWIPLRIDEEELIVELAFLARATTSTGSTPLPIVPCAIRLSYDNYDLWPPSLTFIDALTREPTRPHVRAFLTTEDGLRDVLIDAHPDTGQPFLCVPGIREYHTHPQHTGDDWKLHRDQGKGSITTICERVWRFMALNVIGLRMESQILPGMPLRAQIKFVVAQGDVEALKPPQPVRMVMNSPAVASEN